MIQWNWQSPEALKYGIVSISVANIRRLSVFQSELVNQTLMGTIVQILDERDEFYYIRNWDDYTGWVSKLSLTVVDEDGAREWWKSEKVMVTENYGIVRSSPDATGEILTDLVPCVELKYLRTVNNFHQVELPDGRIGFLTEKIVRREAEQHSLRVSSQFIVETARSFLGIPYLWGGTSAKGFDCSGFVQTVFRLLNIQLPRDTGPMSRKGSEIQPIDPSHLQTGDLIFFGKALNRINHVAIYLGNGQYIHAYGRVRINSMIPGDVLYNERLHKLMVKAVRISELFQT